MVTLIIGLESAWAAEDTEPEAGRFESTQRGGATLALGYGRGRGDGGFAAGVTGSVGNGLVGLPIWLVGSDLARTGGMFMTGVRFRPPVVPLFVDALLGYTKVEETEGAGLSAGGALGVDLRVAEDVAVTAGGALGARFDGGAWGCGFVGPTILF